MTIVKVMKSSGYQSSTGGLLLIWAKPCFISKARSDLETKWLANFVECWRKKALQMTLKDLNEQKIFQWPILARCQLSPKGSLMRVFQFKLRIEIKIWEWGNFEKCCQLITFPSSCEARHRGTLEQLDDTAIKYFGCKEAKMTFILGTVTAIQGLLFLNILPCLELATLW